jgi:hypothetical protein
MTLGETAGTSNPSQKAEEQTCQTEWWSSVLLATRGIMQMDESSAGTVLLAAMPNMC